MTKILNNTNEADSNVEIELLRIDWYSEDGQRMMEMTGNLEVTTIEAAEAALPEILKEMIEVCNDEQEHIDDATAGEFKIHSESGDIFETIKCDHVKTA